MTAHIFLSPEWIDAAEEIHAEYIGRFDPPDEVVRVNVIVDGCPFGDGTLHGHIDTTDGSSRPQHGHLDDPEATVRIPWDVARSLFVSQDFEIVATAFMTGQIDIEGDVTRFLYLQNLEPSPEQIALGEEIAERLSAITAD